MSDRTCFILSFLFHMGLISYFLITPKPRQWISPSYIPVAISQVMPQPETIAQKEPEPKNPVPKPKPEENTITHMRTPRPTLAPTEKPTPTPKPSRTPSPTPTPTFTPTPTPKKLTDETINRIKDLLKETPTPQPKKTPTPKPTPKPTSKPTPAPTQKPTPIVIDAGQVDITNLVTPGSTSSNVASQYQFTIQGGDSNFDFSPYAGILSNILQQKWRAPTVMRPAAQEYVTVVSFTVSRMGVITNVKIEKESGWPLMDQTVLEAIQMANPVTPL
ncbi:MAG: TonB C-terminal domain-containing protein, partial [bacterium]|nr:TonB C-terminal domain-containing protein [bacterium]